MPKAAEQRRMADNELEALGRFTSSFDERYRSRTAEWQTLLDDCKTQGRKAVLWGSGSKGVAFLTAMENPDALEYVVDINPYRQGHYMVGFGQEIVSPEFLQDYKPDLVVVMNRIYTSEIGSMLEKLSLNTEIRAL